MAIDFNAPSQVRPYANLAAFPVTGAVKTIYIAEDTNKIYRWTGSAYVEISQTDAITWGSITGTLSAQTDLQTALDAKFDDPTGNATQYLDGAGAPTTFPTALPPSGTAGGDLTGTYPNPTVHRVHGIDMQNGTPSADDVWVYGGSPAKWQHQHLNASQVDNDSSVTGTTVELALEHLDSTKVPTTRTISTTAPLTGGGDLSANRTLSIPKATTLVDGYLSSTDWNTFNGKQSALVSGTSIKTINSTSLLGSGDVAVQPTLVSGTNIKTINGTTILGSGDLTISTGITIGTTAITSGTVGRVLFEGTGNVVQESANLFWDNTNARLGVGTATPNYTFELKNTTGGATTPTLSFVTSTYNSQIIVGNSTYPFALGANSLNVYHGVAGGIGFYNGSASPTLRFSILSDGKTIVGSATTATRIFEVNNTVNGGGIGLNSAAINTSYAIVHTATGANSWAFNSAGTGSSQSAGTLSIGATTNNVLFFSNGNTVLGASNSTDAGFKLDVNGTARVRGTGATSATTSLSIQNSAGTNAFVVKDDLNVFIGNGTTGTGNSVLDQRVPRLYTFGDGTVGHYITSTLNGGTGDTSLALVGVGTGGGYSGSVRVFTSSNSATPNLAMIVDRNQSVGIGLTNSTNLTVNASAKLQIDSTTKGFLPPRMTTTEKNAIATPATGLMVYDTTLNLIYVWNGTIWISL